MARTSKKSSKKQADATGAEVENPSYNIDKQTLKASGISYQYLLYSRLCRRGGCDLCEKHNATDMVAPLPSAPDLTRYIASFCFKEEDYPSPETSLLEIVFLLLVKSKRSMTLDDIEQKLLDVWKNNVYIKNRSRENIMKVLDAPNNYAIVRQQA
jgi:hypothetical protein